MGKIPEGAGWDGGNREVDTGLRVCNASFLSSVRGRYTAPYMSLGLQGAVKAGEIYFTSIIRYRRTYNSYLLKSPCV